LLQVLIPNNGVDNDNNGITLVGNEVRTNYIDLTANSNTVDIGLKGTSTISDFVFYDVNANGIQDAIETGIPGVTVSITKGTMTLITTTDATGHYLFNGLVPSLYTIGFTTPAGYLASPANQGADRNVDSDPSGGSVIVNLAADVLNTAVDAGFYQLVNLGSSVWFDLNLNGIKDAGEPAVGGVTVKLYLDANNDNIADGAAITTTTTSASGVYAFNSLTPNNYIVGITPPAGYAIVTTNGGDPDNDVDNDNNGTVLTGGEVRSNAVTLTSSGEPTNDGDGINGNLTVDFALKATGAIGDNVWNDNNGNGIQDAGEQGLQGVAVTITPVSGSAGTTVTDASGNYLYSDIY
jgi:hypothetical protein